MPLERHLPENEARRTELQLLDVQRQLGRYNEALEFAQKALGSLTCPPLPYMAADGATLNQLRVTIKCIEADRATALRHEESAYRIYCDTNHLEPERE